MLSIRYNHVSATHTHHTRRKRGNQRERTTKRTTETKQITKTARMNIVINDKMTRGAYYKQLSSSVTMTMKRYGTAKVFASGILSWQFEKNSSHMAPSLIKTGLIFKISVLWVNPSGIKMNMRDWGERLTTWQSKLHRRSPSLLSLPVFSFSFSFSTLFRVRVKKINCKIIEKAEYYWRTVQKQLWLRRPVFLVYAHHNSIAEHRWIMWN